jgi:hypothetical protein
MMPRREFTKAVQAQIVHRATNPAGHVSCEGCGLVLGKRPYHIDHTIADALIVQKRTLTADDGKLLGVECCHAPKTKQDVKVIAEAKRREARDLGLKTKPKQKIPSRPKEPKLLTKVVPRAHDIFGRPITKDSTHV